MGGCGFSFGGGGAGSSSENIIPSPEGGTITEDQSGATFTNEGAAGSVEFTLPDNPAIGTNFKFLVVDANTVFVYPGSSAQPIVLYPDGSAEFGINSTPDAGQSIWLVYSKENMWSVISFYGGWTIVTPP